MILNRRTPAPGPAPADQDELRRRADDARERLLASIVVRVPPPPLLTRTDPRTVVASGCLLCGLAAIEVPGSHRSDGVVDVPVRVPGPGEHGSQSIGTWRTLAIDRGSLRTADVDRERLAATLWRMVVCRPHTIGAPPSGSDVTGYLCPACADAVADEGAIGVQAITAALGHDAATVEVPRLRGVTFGSQVLAARRSGDPEPAPSRSRWEHVDLDTAGITPPAAPTHPDTPLRLTMPVRSTEPVVTEATS